MVRKLDRTKDGDVVQPDRGGTLIGGPAPLRKLLRELGSAQMWQVEEAGARGHKRPAIRYEVSRFGVVSTFLRPHEAWEHFQKLTNAPNAPPEPARPPVKAHARTRTSGE